MDLFSELQNLMVKYHFRPAKKLSQFYCINEALLRYLVNSAKLESKDVVLEIGPGTGFLTRLLLEKCKVVAVEADPNMIELLNGEFEKEIASGKLTLVEGDILEQDFAKLGVNKIVALPPYHISSGIMTKIILSHVDSAVLVFDSGFIEKVVSFEGCMNYNALTVLTNLNSKAELLERVESESFFPKPNCVSGVLKLAFDRKNNSKEFLAFLKELFRHKNKDLSRALKQAAPFLEKELSWKKELTKKFNEMELSNSKVYALSPIDLLEVFEELNK
jgi:16S rRNA (adenine1518-N6/adenine1519-N6)-dimethyltransferase